MTPSELSRLASSVYGHNWQSALSRDMRIALRTVQRWAVDGITKTATSEGVKSFLERRSRIKLSGPKTGTSEDERDDLAFEECEPYVTALVSAGVDAGFHEAEILAAVLSIVVDRMRAGAGIPATIEALRQAINGLKELRDT